MDAFTDIADVLTSTSDADPSESIPDDEERTCGGAGGSGAYWWCIIAWNAPFLRVSHGGYLTTATRSFFSSSYVLLCFQQLQLANAFRKKRPRWRQHNLLSLISPRCIAPLDITFKFLFDTFIHTNPSSQFFLLLHPQSLTPFHLPIGNTIICFSSLQLFFWRNRHFIATGGLWRWRWLRTIPADLLTCNFDTQEVETRLWLYNLAKYFYLRIRMISKYCEIYLTVSTRFHEVNWIDNLNLKPKFATASDSHLWKQDYYIYYCITGY